jgi:hypothetical protein
MPKISGLTIVRNAISNGYLIAEVLDNLAMICDEIIVCDGYSNDGTYEYLQNRPDIKIYQDHWDLNSENGLEFANITNLGMSRCNGDYIFYLQADEIIHENQLGEIKKAIYSDEFNSINCKFIHIRYDLQHRLVEGYKKAIRIIRNINGINSDYDAYNFAGDIHPIYDSNIMVYHFGYIFPKNILAKMINHSTHFYQNAPNYKLRHDLAKNYLQKINDGIKIDSLELQKILEPEYTLHKHFYPIPKSMERLRNQTEYTLPPKPQTIIPIKRTTDILSPPKSVSHLRPVFTFPNFPIFMGVTDDPQYTDLKMDMQWAIAPSGLIQLAELVPLDLLYRREHNPGVTGKTWELHHQKFADFIIKTGECNNILEIGGASGTLLKHFTGQFNWTMLEPSNKTDHKDSRVQIIPDYLESHDFGNLVFDTIIHSHIFEHTYEPLTFLNKLNLLMDQNSKQFISVPNLKVWLERGYTNALNFEHTFYLDESVIEYMLNISGFKIIRRLIDNHSIFLEVQKDKITPKAPKLSYIKKMFDNYITNLQNDVNHILEKTKNKAYYLFGAHIFSQALLSVGLDEKQIIVILDNNNNKWRKRLYGTNLFVQSPKILAEVESPLVVVRGGVYTNEIIEGIKAINNKTEFV